MRGVYVRGDEVEIFCVCCLRLSTAALAGSNRGCCTPWWQELYPPCLRHAPLNTTLRQGLWWRLLFLGVFQRKRNRRQKDNSPAGVPPHPFGYLSIVSLLLN